MTFVYRSSTSRNVVILDDDQHSVTLTPISSAGVGRQVWQPSYVPGGHYLSNRAHRSEAEMSPDKRPYQR